jgi:hypothetical protein
MDILLTCIYYTDPPINMMFLLEKQSHNASILYII